MTNEQKVNRVVVEGEMTIFRAAELKPLLIGGVAPETIVELDLAGVDEMDTSGVQLLVHARRAAEEQAGGLRIAEASVAVRETLDLAGAWHEVVSPDPAGSAAGEGGA